MHIHTNISKLQRDSYRWYHAWIRAYIHIYIYIYMFIRICVYIHVRPYIYTFMFHTYKEIHIVDIMREFAQGSSWKFDNLPICESKLLFVCTKSREIELHWHCVCEFARGCSWHFDNLTWQSKEKGKESQRERETRLVERETRLVERETRLVFDGKKERVYARETERERERAKERERKRERHRVGRRVYVSERGRGRERYVLASSRKKNIKN